MIIYKNTASGFREDVDTNKIADRVSDVYLRIRSRNFSPQERSAINNSMSFMEKIIRRSSVADDCGILIEYVIPSTNNRIDFMISGKDSNGNKNFIIIELKQWQHAESTTLDGVVKTQFKGGMQETTHPSYQASSYKTFLKDFNEGIYDGGLHPYSCAYLHNYAEQNPEPLRAKIYQELLEDTPLYFKDDHARLEQFIQKYVGKGSGMDILYEIESGRIRPSKMLIDHVTKLFEGNQEFVLLDEQKVAFETAYSYAKKRGKKSVIIIKGGPGTGKSVISVNLLGKLLQDKLNTVFVAPNSSFRNVLSHRLAQTHRRNRLKSLFKGSAGFYESQKNEFDVLIVDEAHRLKNGTAYQYYGENQVEDIINASNTSIFFVDDNQSVRPEDIGSVREINKYAEIYGAEVKEIELVAQFRCAGAEGYINWLNDILLINDTANFDGWDSEQFDFQIFDDPNEMRKAIKLKSEEGLKARILAGYAWKWTSSREGNENGEIADVEIPEFDFRMPWNARRIGTTWAIDSEGIDQVGCIHTSQGLEFDYVGVIVGNDLKYDPVNRNFYTEWDEYKDASGKRGLKEDLERLNKYVRNIYKILMSRGMKGCYVYFMDKRVEEYVRGRMS